jgi:hypothetical protein
VHGSLGENDEQSVAYGPTPGPLRPALARTASLTHVSTHLILRCQGAGVIHVRRPNLITNKIAIYRLPHKATTGTRDLREPLTA